MKYNNLHIIFLSICNTDAYVIKGNQFSWYEASQRAFFLSYCDSICGTPWNRNIKCICRKYLQISVRDLLIQSDFYVFLVRSRRSVNLFSEVGRVSDKLWNSNNVPLFINNAGFL